MTRDEQLLEAAFVGDCDGIRSALTAGADIEARDERGEPSLLIATRQKHVAAVKEILAAHARTDCTDEFGNQPLHYAANYGLVEAIDALLDAGAAVNPNNRFGWTPLHTAANWRHPAAVQRLLERGADRTLSDEEGMRADQVTGDRSIRSLLQANLTSSDPTQGFLRRLTAGLRSSGWQHHR